MQYANPSSSFGYYRGAPLYMGQGSGQGNPVAGQGVFAPGQGGANGQSAWSPTIMYMFVLIIAEMFVFAFIGRHI